MKHSIFGRRIAMSALLASLFLAGPSFAAPPPPPLADRPVAEEVNLDGQISRFLINPYGEVDGLLIDRNQIVKFPPHMSEKLVATVGVGDRVRIQGLRESAASVKADVIVNQANGRMVVERPPHLMGITPPGPRERAAGLENMQVSGHVALVLTGPEGDTNGVILDNDAIVRFGPMVVRQAIVPGQMVMVSGVGTRNNYGVCVEALELKVQGAGQTALAAPPVPPAPPAPPAP